MLKKLIIGSVGIALLTSAAPAMAGFYLEGMAAYRQAPNCVDEFATKCGRDSLNLESVRKPDSQALPDTDYRDYLPDRVIAPKKDGKDGKRRSIEK